MNINTTVCARAIRTFTRTAVLGVFALFLPRYVSAALMNPLSGISTIPDLLLAVLNIVITIAVPIIILFIIIAGFQYVTARGNAQQTQNASRALMYAIIGGLLIIGAVAITEIIRNIVAAF